MNQIGMDLPQSDQGPKLLFVRGAKLLQKSSAVFLDEIAGVFLGESQI
jgi:hypothetical protein